MQPGEFLRQVARRERTHLIKETIGQLGKRLGQGVAASGCKCADDGEWLYDMMWYERDARGFFTRQSLVLESEWFSPPREAAVDSDFEKLLQAKADVRVWIYAARNADRGQEHVALCREAIAGFAGTVSGDLYLLVVLNWTDHTKYYFERHSAV